MITLDETLKYIHVINALIIDNTILESDLNSIEFLIASTKIQDYINQGGKTEYKNGILSIIE